MYQPVSVFIWAVEGARPYNVSILLSFCAVDAVHLYLYK